jgi:probable rRNA maturation factor
MVEVNNKTKEKVDLNLVRTVAENFFNKYRLNKKDLSIAFVSDATIRKLNKIYRKIDKVTDILSFAGEDDFLGEIVIDYAQIKRQAREYKKSIKDELVFILVHGLLHLIGFNDNTEKERQKMMEIGRKFIIQNIK